MEERLKERVDKEIEKILDKEEDLTQDEIKLLDYYRTSLINERKLENIFKDINNLNKSLIAPEPIPVTTETLEMIKKEEKTDD